MHHDATSYFLHRGQEHGFEYELAREFARQLGVTLQVRTPPPGIALTQWLIEGRGDIAAGVVVPDDSPSTRVRYSDAYDVSVRLEPARMGWAVRPELEELLAAVNQYHAQTKRSGLRKILYEKYFTSTRFLRSDESTVFSNRLSQYDPLIARYAEQAGFDWRLIAALIFEESRFDPKRRSRRGARWAHASYAEVAARQVGVKNFRTPCTAIWKPATKYLQLSP